MKTKVNKNFELIIKVKIYPGGKRLASGEGRPPTQDGVDKNKTSLCVVQIVLESFDLHRPQGPTTSCTTQGKIYI